MNNYDWAVLTRKQTLAMLSNSGDVEYQLLCGIAGKLEDYLHEMDVIRKDKEEDNFLLSNGFKLEQYPDGKFWVLRADEELFLQCSEDGADFTLCDNGWVETNLMHEEVLVAIKTFKGMESRDD